MEILFPEMFNIFSSWAETLIHIQINYLGVLIRGYVLEGFHKGLYSENQPVSGLNFL